MAIQKDYTVYGYDYYKPTSEYDGRPWSTSPVFLPDWIMNAPLKFKKVVRVLGCTATLFDESTGEISGEVPKGIRLMGNLTKNTILNEFVGMTNNYRCVKEFDITYNNLRELTWYLIGPTGKAYPEADSHVNLTIECELSLTAEAP
jgi:hypothetical protein